MRQDQRSKDVFFVAPFTTKDLCQRSIADTVHDLDKFLTVLYNHPTPIPKAAFEKFRTPPQSVTAHGYVPHTLKTHVQGQGGQGEDLT